MSLESCRVSACKWRLTYLAFWSLSLLSYVIFVLCLDELLVNGRATQLGQSWSVNTSTPPSPWWHLPCLGFVNKKQMTCNGNDPTDCVMKVVLRKIVTCNMVVRLQTRNISIKLFPLMSVNKYQTKTIAIQLLSLNNEMTVKFWSIFDRKQTEFSRYLLTNK